MPMLMMMRATEQRTMWARHAERMGGGVWRRTGMRCGILALGLLGSTACGDLVGTAVLPPGTQSPATYNTVDGALGAYRGVKQFVASGHNSSGPLNNGGFFGIEASGALTDELAYIGRAPGAVSIGGIGEPVDERFLPDDQHTVSLDNVRRPYLYLNGVRGRALEAIGLLRTYAPGTSPALRGELQALEGYAEVLLGELYCSGVPLSTLDFEGDFTYKPGSTTTEVWQHAVALLDSAIAVSSDSARVVRFAQVLKGRALLDLGDYAMAAQAVAGVLDGFTYAVLQPPASAADSRLFANYTVADREGQNGLPFVSSGDPRSAVVLTGTNPLGLPLYAPAKYPGSVNVNVADSVVLASGVEARLIEAEAALQANPTDLTWLNILNTLRTTCSDAASCSTPAPAGTGGVSGLPPLSDPGSDTARVSLLFSERAYWLFLTGHRQGDLRRLVRNYGRSQQTVYPTGTYFGGLGIYGLDVTLPVPEDEQPNPLFQGCLDRNA
jgi:hypothetical protein